jgi:hypothetical protein
MPYEVYKILHLAGLAAMFAAMGAAALAPTVRAKLVAAPHGTALLIVLVSGFGMHAKLGIPGFPIWLVGKLVLWAAFGGLLAVARRVPNAAMALWVAIPVLTAIAAWLAVAKPG